MQDLTGRGLLTLLARPLPFSKTNTDMFDDMFEARRDSRSRLTFGSAIIMSNSAPALGHRSHADRLGSYMSSVHARTTCD